MADLDVVIFTFTQSECDAVNYLLGKYLNPVGRKSLIWRSRDMFSGKLVAKLDNNKTIQIEHKPLRAQGNVNAAAELARAANTKPRADYYIFYGCCGAIRHDHIGKVFRVNRVSYFSLGSVKKQSITSKSANPQPAAPPTAAAATGSITAAKKGAAAKPTSATGTTKTVARQPTTPPVNPPPAKPTKPAPAATTVESAKLKNKWFVYTTPNYQAPFGSIELPRHTTGPLINLKLTEAFVLATDKVIHVKPDAKAPVPAHIDPRGPLYNDEEWTYAQALAHCRDHINDPVLIDMETFGIASTMRALTLEENVLVLRVVTDALTNKAKQKDGYQLELLKKQLPVLNKVLATIFGIA